MWCGVACAALDRVNDRQQPRCTDTGDGMRLHLHFETHSYINIHCDSSNICTATPVQSPVLHITSQVIHRLQRDRLLVIHNTFRDRLQVIHNTFRDRLQVIHNTFRDRLQVIHTTFRDRLVGYS